MSTDNAEFVGRYKLRFLSVHTENDFAVADKCAFHDLFFTGEEELSRSCLCVCHNGVIRIKRGEILFGLILEHTHFCGDICFHAAETVDMVFGYVEKTGSIAAEINNAFKLQRGSFRNDGIACFSVERMCGYGDSDVPENIRIARTDTLVVLGENLTGQGCSGGFAVRSADAYESCSAV